MNRPIKIVVKTKQKQNKANTKQKQSQPQNLLSSDTSTNSDRQFSSCLVRFSGFSVWNITRCHIDDISCSNWLDSGNVQQNQPHRSIGLDNNYGDSSITTTNII